VDTSLSKLLGSDQITSVGVHCQLLKTFEKMTVVLQLAKKSVVDGNLGRKEERKRSPFVQVLYDYEPG